MIETLLFSVSLSFYSTVDLRETFGWFYKSTTGRRRKVTCVYVYVCVYLRALVRFHQKVSFSTLYRNSSSFYVTALCELVKTSRERKRQTRSKRQENTTPKKILLLRLVERRSFETIFCSLSFPFTFSLSLFSYLLFSFHSRNYSTKVTRYFLKNTINFRTIELFTRYNYY